MAFHHAQPHKPSSSDDYEPLNVAPQHIDREKSGLVEPPGAQNSDFEDYDDEARFELLSAYVDNEVTVQERKLVAQWLMTDSSTQQMYQRLLMLRLAICTAPVPVHTTLLKVPTPDQQSWGLLSSWSLRHALVCVFAIALLGSLSQLHTGGHQPLQEAWHYIKALPADMFKFLPANTLSELASTLAE